MTKSHDFSQVPLMLNYSLLTGLDFFLCEYFYNACKDSKTKTMNDHKLTHSFLESTFTFDFFLCFIFYCLDDALSTFSELIQFLNENLRYW